MASITTYSKIGEHLGIMEKDINSASLYDHAIVMLSNLEFIKHYSVDEYNKTGLKDLWTKMERFITICQQFKGNDYCDNLLFTGIKTNNRDVNYTNLWMYKPSKLLEVFISRLYGQVYFLFDYKVEQLWDPKKVAYGTKVTQAHKEQLANFASYLIKIYKYFDKSYLKNITKDLDLFANLFECKLQ